MMGIQQHDQTNPLKCLVLSPEPTKHHYYPHLCSNIFKCVHKRTHEPILKSTHTYTWTHSKVYTHVYMKGASKLQWIVESTFIDNYSPPK